MSTFREKYINPFTDFGFKRLFGEDSDKSLLLDFLNELLREEQAKKCSQWDFKLEKVYTIAILDFEFDEDKEYSDKYRYDIKLKDIETNKVFLDKSNFIYLEIPKFKKT